MRQYAAGYLVENGKMLLAHHVKFDLWVPPGGHLEPQETPEQTVVREFLEETGLDVRVINPIPLAFSHHRVVALPFHIEVTEVADTDLELGFFYFVKRNDVTQLLVPQIGELYNLAWFGHEDLDDLKTFEQTRMLARYALINYPEDL